MSDSESLHLGISVPNQHPRDADPVAGMHAQLELVRAARDLGWSSAWTGQHFLIADLQMTQPIPYLGRLAAESGDMRLGLGIALAALSNPVQLAEDLASLDVISGGRLIAGVGLGYREEEYAAFAVPKGQRVHRLEANLAALEQLWTGEPTTIDLPWCRTEDAVLSILPVQKPRPPIWVAAHADAAVRRAARLGDAWFVSPHINIETARRQLEVFADERRAVGRPPAVEIPLAKEMYCAPTRQQAVELAGPYVTGKYRSYARWGQDRILPEDVSFEADLEELETGRWVLGSPDDCIEQLVPVVRDLGVNHLVCRMTWLGMPVELSIASLRLFTEEVVPVLRAEARAAAPA